MSVEVLDGATVRDFVEDESSFNGSIEDCFALLDANKDGVLSYEEMVKEIESFRLLDTHFGVDEIKTPPEDVERVYGSIFEKFDRDGSGEVDLKEFREETKEKVEVDYLRVTGGGESEFLDKAIGADNVPKGLPNGITGITRHTLQG